MDDRQRKFLDQAFWGRVREEVERARTLPGTQDDVIKVVTNNLQGDPDFKTNFTLIGVRQGLREFVAAQLEQHGVIQPPRATP